jgi:predicted flap endonuclease-1-like 5' DNA nuclease
MIGAIIFVIVFVMFVLIGLAGIGLPPGDWLLHEYINDIYQTDYAQLAEGIVNGVIYGIIIWFAFSIAMMIYEKLRGPKELVVKVEQTSNSTEIEEEKQTTSKALMDIEEIEGIGSKYGKKLKDQGIMTTDGLLSTGSTPKGRKQLADKTGISEKKILEWVNLADLLRIRGVGQEYSDLLEEAGVDTVVELARRNPDNLHEKILEVNKTKQLVRKSPSLNQVKAWIEQAKNLPRKVEY